MARRRKKSAITRSESMILGARLRLLGYKSYSTYLRSPLWFRNRSRLIKQRCERCGERKGLQLHHRSYASLGAELAEHVSTLCDPCHRKEHGLGPRRPRRRKRKP